jgi:uncharacterized protein YprB with RNaseH-like and TPR domain
MDDDTKLQKDLRRLGVVKGARNLKPAPPIDPRSSQPAPPPILPVYADRDDGFAPLDRLLPEGYWQQTAVGQCFIYDQIYTLDYRHGDGSLRELLAYQPDQLAPYLRGWQEDEISFQDVLFLDTETTGLAGAGSIAFMVGLAYFAHEALVVRQLFVPDFADEAAMLLLLEELAAGKQALVTFNGRTFDIPLLDGRYAMNRMTTDIRRLPHLDLLPLSRRLWRTRLGSVALGALEPNLLGVHRTQDDVPGWLIPSLYHQYLRTGDARELLRVFYHNRLDMLSMVTLAAQIVRLCSQPTSQDHPLDLHSLGCWQAALGLTELAEQQLRLAAQGDLPLAVYRQSLNELAQLYKRNGRRADAVLLWQQIAATTFDDIAAHVELAKYYEWHDVNLTQALRWTEEALRLTGTWGWRGALVQDELAHRRERIRRKMAGES